MIIRIMALSALLICIGAVMVISAASGPYWTKTYPLSAGLGAMHEIQVENGAELVLHSPPGSNYDLYALYNPRPFGSCPSNSYIMSRATKSTAGMGTDVLILEPGLWCLVVYAQSGSGTYLLEASTLETGYMDPFGGSDDSEEHYGNYSMPSDSDDGLSLGTICAPYRSVVNNGVVEAWDESFEDNLLDYPEYTKPQNFRGMEVPEVLLSGHHKNIEEFRKEEALKRTKQVRPDLLKEE